MFPGNRYVIRKTYSTFADDVIPAATISSTNNIAGMISGTWGSANRAVYCPIVIREYFKVEKLAVLNGSSATGNIDVGVYSENGTKIWSSGSTAQSGTSVMQVFTPTAFILPPGRYYIAMAASSASTTITGRVFVNEIARLCGFAVQASAFALPSTATFAAAPATLRAPLIVLSGNSVI